MKLPRPYIPLRVRVQVAERQYGIPVHWREGFSDRAKLVWLLQELFGDQKVELHHRPALCNRLKVEIHGSSFRYDPEANDPDYLAYVTEADHSVETRVRGLHGQHSDLGLLRKSKRILRKRTKRKFKWPKRKFPRRKK